MPLIEATFGDWAFNAASCQEELKMTKLGIEGPFENRRVKSHLRGKGPHTATELMHRLYGGYGTDGTH